MGAGIPPAMVLVFVLAAVIGLAVQRIKHGIDVVAHTTTKVVHTVGCGTKKVLTGHGCAPADTTQAP